VPAAIYPKQVELYMEAKRKGLTQSAASAKAGISSRTARRIEKGTHRPQRGRPRDWKTREDPLDGIWERELQPMLEAEPRLDAMSLFEELQERYPQGYEDKLRTVQRRVSKWKAMHGKAKEVMFKIEHPPGEMGLSDFTHLKGVQITVAGKPFQHILYHYRLAFSGWQYVQVIQGGESFIGLSQGLQNALFASGGVPRTHRTDSLSAAYRNTGGRNPKLTQMYAAVCAHYRMQPTRNNTGVAHENGSIESPHGYFKRRLCQALYRRRSFEFESVAQYQAFIAQVIAKLNGKCQKKFATEQTHLQPLPYYRTPDYEVRPASVSTHSTINVRCVVYTVPSRLIGQRLTLHLYHDRIVGFLGTTQVVELARVHIHGSQKIRRARSINYRHVAESLRRKPRAFLYCQWQQDLLPNDQWRSVWETLKGAFDPDQAARLITEALYIAATQDQESQVVEYLHTQLQQSTLTLANLQRSFESKLPSEHYPPVISVQHDLSSYDQLLSSASRPSLPNPDVHPPTPQTQALSRRVANPRTSSHPRKLVLCPVPAGFGAGGSSSSGAQSVHTRAVRSAVALRKVLDQF
jgi:transcriptional regulator with XRE-family HTH domain